jgi:hypothetical protein
MATGDSTPARTEAHYFFVVSGSLIKPIRKSIRKLQQNSAYSSVLPSC